MKYFLAILMVLVLLLGLTGMAFAIPYAWGVWDGPAVETAHIVVSPGGTGPPLTEAALLGGAPTDASIHIQLWYQGDSVEDPQPAAPVPYFPAEDIWLDGQGLVFCQGGATADSATDADGWFSFSMPLLGGGSSGVGPGAFPVFVMVNGVHLDDLNENINPNLVVNSPDLNGDLSVNLADLGLFSTDFYGGYDFRSDFFWDGVLNLSDVGRLATIFGDECP